MVPSSGPEYEYTQRSVRDPAQTVLKKPRADFELKIHENELNKHHLQDLADGVDVQEPVATENSDPRVNYTFGDAGAQWRMTKLKGVYRRAREEGRHVDEVAADQFGDLRAFDDAREEELELDRREMYGQEYSGKEKPSGVLFQERKMDVESSNGSMDKTDKFAKSVDAEAVPATTVQVDQTTLNRLKAQMMKAKIRGASDAVALEAKYNAAVAAYAGGQQSEVVMLGAMENRLLAGGRKGEVKAVENKRGRVRGLVEENEDMSVEDMVRQERRTRGQSGGEGRRFAERIAKDGKFDVQAIGPNLWILLTIHTEQLGVSGRERFKASKARATVRDQPQKHCHIRLAKDEPRSRRVSFMPSRRRRYATGCSSRLTCYACLPNTTHRTRDQRWRCKYHTYTTPKQSSRMR